MRKMISQQKKKILSEESLKASWSFWKKSMPKNIMFPKLKERVNKN